jgi:hypothetical protein
MGPPIEQSVKQKVIELYTSGCKSRHDITKELKKQQMRIPYGTVWSTLSAYKLRTTAVTESSSPIDRESNSDICKDPNQLQMPLQAKESNQGEAYPTQQEQLPSLTPENEFKEEAKIALKTQTPINIGTIIADTGTPSSLISLSPHGGGLKPGSAKLEPKNSGAPLQRFFFNNEIVN